MLTAIGIEPVNQEVSILQKTVDTQKTEIRTRYDNYYGELNNT